MDMDESLPIEYVGEGGEHCSRPRPYKLASPRSRMSAERYSSDTRAILQWSSGDAPIGQRVPTGVWPGRRAHNAQQ